MVERLRQLVQFRLERFLLGGPHYRLLVIAALIGLISLGAGLLSYEYVHEHDDPAKAVWWAFLRMTDPGYLGDDEGMIQRIISTVVTVLGYVLFMGALIAIMTQWLHETIRKLEQGLTPIAKRRHVVILGWTERTPEILRELLASRSRVKRFLERFDARRLQIAVLVPDVDHDLVVSLRERLGDRYARDQIILRSGSPLHIDHLRRVDYARAAVLVLPGGDQAGGGNKADHDARTIKTILTIRHHALADGAPGRLPDLVTALHDARHAAVARAAYTGGRCEVIATDGMVGRLMAQTLRHPGLSYVLEELLSQNDGNEIYLRAFPDLVGRRVRELAHAFSDAVLLGVLRETDDGPQPILNPGPDETVAAGDRLILLAFAYEVRRARSPRAGRLPAAAAAAQGGGRRRILILGWNHSVPPLLRELDSHRQEAITVDLFSAVAIAARERRLAQADIGLGRLKLEHHEGDYALPGDLEVIDVTAYDNILIVGSDRLETAEDADARTLLGHHLVMSRIPEPSTGPRILVELRDPTNADLFELHETEVIATGEGISHIVAQIALRGDLRAVLDQLFGPGGPEIAFRPPIDYGIAHGECRFGDVIDAVAEAGETALGLRLDQGDHPAGGLRLNPRRDEPITLAAGDTIVVLTTWDQDAEPD